MRRRPHDESIVVCRLHTGEKKCEYTNQKISHITNLFQVCYVVVDFVVFSYQACFALVCPSHSTCVRHRLVATGLVVGLVVDFADRCSLDSAAVAVDFAGFADFVAAAVVDLDYFDPGFAVAAVVAVFAKHRPSYIVCRR